MSLQLYSLPLLALEGSRIWFINDSGSDYLSITSVSFLKVTNSVGEGRGIEDRRNPKKEAKTIPNFISCPVG